jgi:S-adenosylmethionine/arginine decarboxylase-like enzyme
MNKPYGQELILDLHHCNNMDVDTQAFCEELAELVNMQIEDFHRWESGPEDEKNPKTFGKSAIQFILTSNITIHILPLLGNVYVNLFSCKEFDQDVAADFCEKYFNGVIAGRHFIDRR